MDLNDVNRIADEINRPISTGNFAAVFGRSRYRKLKGVAARRTYAPNARDLLMARAPTRHNSRGSALVEGSHSRLHVAEYSTWELYSYQESDAAGQETFVANRAWYEDLSDLHEEFWIFDSTVIRMIYDTEGHFLYPEEADSIQSFREIRDRAPRHAIPLSDYLKKYEPDFIAHSL